MIGIVLAGGAATRLPNKPLLPMRDGRPIIRSGIDLLTRSGIEDIRVVVPPFSAIPHILQQYTFIPQREPTGVPHAIKLALQPTDNPEARVFVVCADNFFAKDTVIPLSIDTAYACVQFSKSVPPWRAAHLAGWHTELREFHPKCIRPYMSPLAGWLHARVMEWRAVSDTPSLTKALNEMSAGPHFWTDEWWDLGTPETYLEYWQCKG